MKEARTGEVIIEDVSPKTMQIVLKFMYTGKIDPEWIEVAANLIYASDKYQLTYLKKYVDENISLACTLDNVINIRKMAELYKLPMALTVTENFITNNQGSHSSLFSFIFKKPIYHLCLTYFCSAFSGYLLRMSVATLLNRFK